MWHYDVQAYTYACWSLYYIRFASVERTGSRHNRPEASPEQILSDRQQVKPQKEISILSDEN